MTKRFSRSLIGAGISAAMALASVQSFAADTPAAQPTPPAQTKTAANTPAKVPMIERDAVARYAGWKDPQLMEVAVRSGREVVSALRGAHAALERGDVSSARESLAQASAFSGTIRSMSPYTVVMNRFSNAKHETVGTTSSIVVDDMLPIYSSLRSSEAFEVEKSADNTATAQTAMPAQGADQPAAAAKPEQPTKNVASTERVEEVGENIAASTLYLPVGYVSSHIEMARHALTKDAPDMNAAKAAVSDALDSLVQTTVDLHMTPKPDLASGNSAAAKPAAAPATPSHS